MSRPTLEELGISTDTIIIEVDGGLVTEVHNDPNGVVIFDWDNIEGGYDQNGKETSEEDQEQRLDDMLSAIARGK